MPSAPSCTACLTSSGDPALAATSITVPSAVTAGFPGSLPGSLPALPPLIRGLAGGGQIGLARGYLNRPLITIEQDLRGLGYGQQVGPEAEDRGDAEGPGQDRGV